MTAGELIYSYFLAAGLLWIGLAILAAICWVLETFRIDSSKKQLLRVSQILFFGIFISAGFSGELRSHLFVNLLFPQGLSGIEGDHRASGWTSMDGTETPTSVFQGEKKEGVTHRDFTGNSLSLGMVAEVFTIAVFGIGFSIFFLRLFRSVRSLRKLIGGCVIYKRVGKTEILISDHALIPFSTRVCGRAQVVIPIALVTDRPKLKAAVIHEVQHHRNGDTLWILIMEGVILLFYWNPAIYLWKKWMEEYFEFACDEAIIIRNRISKKDYGNCLVRIAELHLNIGNTKNFYNFGSVGMANPKLNSKTPKKQHVLYRRIDMLLKTKKIVSHWKGISLVGLCGVGTLLGFAAAFGVRTDASYQKLHFDPQVQEIANRAVLKQVSESKALQGYAVVTDPNTGRILALSFVDGKNMKPLADVEAAARVMGKKFQANSLIKGLLMAYALEKGKTTVDEPIDCEKGEYRLGDKTYRDHTAFSTLSSAQVVAHSSDIGAIKMAQKLGETELKDLFRKFGFGLGGLANAEAFTEGLARGQINQNSDSNFIPDFANGQNLEVTPLELAGAYGAIANGGKLIPLQTGNDRAQGENILLESTARLMRNALEETVSTGTGKKAKPRHFSAAGKTGTGLAFFEKTAAHSLPTYIYDQSKGLAQFVGFSPVNDPKVLIFVAIEGSVERAYGGAVAAPVFSEIAEETLSSWKVGSR